MAQTDYQRYCLYQIKISKYFEERAKCEEYRRILEKQFSVSWYPRR